MNLDYRFSSYTHRILFKAASAIIGHWDDFDDQQRQYILYQAVNRIEHQLRFFPWEHRLSFVFGLWFLELGGFLGFWGILPFSLLSQEKAEHRIKKLNESSFRLAHLLIQGIKVLVCLSAYSHPDIEKYLGMERRRWRKQRIALRNELVVLSDRREEKAVPTALKQDTDLSEHDYLSFDALQRIRGEK
jgi:hypothetical protein